MNYSSTKSQMRDVNNNIAKTLYLSSNFLLDWSFPPSPRLQWAKTWLWKFASVKLSLLLLRTNPAMLNNLSTPAVVPGTQKIFLVIAYNRGKISLLFSQNFSTSLAFPHSKYKCNSVSGDLIPWSSETNSPSSSSSENCIIDVRFFLDGSFERASFDLITARSTFFIKSSIKAFTSADFFASLRHHASLYSGSRNAAAT